MSTAAVAFALLLGCGGGGDSVAPPTEQPLSVKLSETATVLSVRTELPASSGSTRFEAQAMSFTFAAQVESGPDMGSAINGRLELKGEREDDGVVEIEGRLFPDADPALPSPAELKDRFDADRKALRSAMREDIKVLGEKLREALATGTPHKEAVAAFKAKFEQRVAQYRAALSALIAEYRTARRNGQPGADDDDARDAKGYEVRGTIAAGGAVSLSIDLGDRGKVLATGAIASDGNAKGSFTGPASGDKGSWTAKASDAGQPPAPPTAGTYEAGLAKYTAMCSGCHSAGKVDTTGTAGNLAGEDDDLVSDLGRLDRAMSGIVLTAQDILDLRAFLKAANSPPSPPPPPPSPPPPSPAPCTAQDVTWSQGASSCNASYAGGASGSSAALSDIVGPTTGTATASCSNGVLTVSVPLCSTAAAPPPPPPPPPSPAPCTAQDVTWSQGASSCNASYAGGASGSSAALSDIVGPTTGTATASCSNGALTVSAPLCSTAAPPPPPPPPTGTFDAGLAKYNAACAGCHKAGGFDPTGQFSDLKGKQNNVVANLGSLSGLMNGITLTAQEVLDLKVFLSQVQ